MNYNNLGLFYIIVTVLFQWFALLKPKWKRSQHICIEKKNWHYMYNYLCVHSTFYKLKTD